MRGCRRVPPPHPVPAGRGRPASASCGHSAENSPYHVPLTSLLIEGEPPVASSRANDDMIDRITGVLEQFKIDAMVTGYTCV